MSLEFHVFKGVGSRYCSCFNGSVIFFLCPLRGVNSVSWVEWSVRLAHCGRARCRSTRCSTSLSRLWSACLLLSWYEVHLHAHLADRADFASPCSVISTSCRQKGSAHSLQGKHPAWASSWPRLQGFTPGYIYILFPRPKAKLDHLLQLFNYM